jgi:hypothetical protein
VPLPEVENAALSPEATVGMVLYKWTRKSALVVVVPLFRMRTASIRAMPPGVVTVGYDRGTTDPAVVEFATMSPLA